MDNLNFNIDPQLKKEVEAILLKEGVRPVDAVKALYEAIKKQKGMPSFKYSDEKDTTELLLNNPETAEKLRKAEEDFQNGKRNYRRRELIKVD